MTTVKRAALIYPHQLFSPHPALQGCDLAVLVEDPLFFKQYDFHAQKLVFHRASMNAWASAANKDGHAVETVRADELSHTGDIARWLERRGIKQVRVVETCDDWLERRLEKALRRAKISCEIVPDPHVLTPRSVFESFGEGKRAWFFTDFYIEQRRRLRILVDEDGKPTGKKWSFDTENRRKLPQGLVIPTHPAFRESAVVTAAKASVASDFPKALGNASRFAYPTTHAEAQRGLEHFMEHHAASFGDYEDAISSRETFLFHSVLTPALNSGLLSPSDVIKAALARKHTLPMNSLEGFLRQVIGWREYIRGVYLRLGRTQRTSNVWGHTRPMPRAFYDGTSGIEPVDTVIRRVREHAYCHHIERLMILGNFFLLCEIHPDAIYRWFMELFIDAYDWVMVPNVYGMSQYSDGGLITTKPYISGSAYVLRMSDFSRGPWCEIWDALYWRFIHKHADVFARIPRTGMITSQARKMGPRLDALCKVADRFLDRLHA
jgi:deoxyribodipyrimidine photolyase-related protein